MGQEALFDPIDFGEVVECFVGKFGIGGLLQDGEEDPAGFLVIVLTDCEDSLEEVGADRDCRIEVLREVGEYFPGLIVDSLGHVGFTDPEARFEGFGLIFVDV